MLFDFVDILIPVSALWNVLLRIRFPFLFSSDLLFKLILYRHLRVFFNLRSTKLQDSSLEIRLDIVSLTFIDKSHYRCRNLQGY